MPTSADIYYHFYEGSPMGERPALVLIHGAGGDHLYWPPNIRRLPGYRVYALDLPGHGKSGGRGMQTVSSYSEVILDWMESIGLVSAVIGGHSMGSAIALDLALDHPQQITGLVLISTGPRMPVNPKLIEAASSPTTYYTAIDKVVEWSFSAIASQSLKDLAERRMREIRHSVLHGDFIACDIFDVTDRLSEINKPTLVICGTEDRMTPLRYSQYVADSIPGASLVTIPEAGHMVTLECPQLIAGAILEFLDTLFY